MKSVIDSDLSPHYDCHENADGDDAVNAVGTVVLTHRIFKGGLLPWVEPNPSGRIEYLPDRRPRCKLSFQYSVITDGHGRDKGHCS